MTVAVVPAELRNPPPPEARRWVEQAVGPRSRVVRVRRLRNAYSSAMHAVDVDVDGPEPAAGSCSGAGLVPTFRPMRVWLRTKLGL